MLSQADYMAMRVELRSLCRYCERTGESLESLIRVPPRVAAAMRAQATSPEETEAVERALTFRAEMLREAGYL